MSLIPFRRNSPKSPNTEAVRALNSLSSHRQTVVEAKTASLPLRIRRSSSDFGLTSFMTTGLSSIIGGGGSAIALSEAGLVVGGPILAGTVLLAGFFPTVWGLSKVHEKNP